MRTSRGAADLFLGSGVFIEIGPHRHATQQTLFPHVYEPVGNRIELCNPLTRPILAPGWRTMTWTEAERAKGQGQDRGLKMIESLHAYGTRPSRFRRRTGGAAGPSHGPGRPAG